MLWGWGPPFSAWVPLFGAGVLPLGLVLLKQCPAPRGRVLAPVHMLGMEVKLRALRCFLSETGVQEHRRASVAQFYCCIP